MLKTDIHEQFEKRTLKFSTSFLQTESSTVQRKQEIKMVNPENILVADIKTKSAKQF